MPRVLSEQQRSLSLQKGERLKIHVKFSVLVSFVFSTNSVFAWMLILFANSYSWGSLWVSFAIIVPYFVLTVFFEGGVGKESS